MAYAAIVSLKQTLEGLLDSSRSRVHIPNLDLELIHDDLCHLKSFFDKVKSLEDSNSVEELEKSVKDAVVSTQDLIESHVSDMFHAGSERSGDASSISAFSRDLLEFREKLGSLTKTMKDMDFSRTDNQKSTSRIDVGGSLKKVEMAYVAGSSRTDFTRAHRIVGLDTELLMLLDAMTYDSRRIHVIAIVGMGGMGKTTLAKTAFLHPFIIDYFDIRLFVGIGVEYELKELLLRLLGEISREVKNELTVDELRMHLYKYLKGRRYLIVLDDIWDATVCSELQRLIPDDRNGSAIILTSRLSNVAHLCVGERRVIEMSLLDVVSSWVLLLEMAFPETEECPPELIEIGRTIVERLEGLPLAIVVVGKLLRMSVPRVENWMAVAENLSSHILEDGISMILKLSYTQLPQHLKACFLYFGIFPLNHNIPTTQLIKLWVAEGFIEPLAGKSLELQAEEYLEDLVFRSLVFVHERSSRGEIRTCRVHSIVHNLCVSEARQEKLFHIVSESSNTSPQGTKNQRRLGIHSHAVLGSKLMQSVSAARSLVFMYPHHHELVEYLRFKWLRVLHALSFRCRVFPDEVLKLVRLRYLAITYDGELPSSISRLWNLEVLIIHRSQSIKFTVSLPSEIWKLHKLRHLEYMGCYLPDPSTDATGDRDECSMEKLLTLSGVSARSCTQGVLARMPNLMKLGVWFEPTYDTVVFFNSGYILTHLQRLESFKFVGINCDLQPEAAAASSLRDLPSGLRKISLSGCGFAWEDMSIIAALPHLQVLKLRCNAFCGPEWKTWDGGFSRLKFLLLEDLDVVQLIAETSHFPVLQQLLIRLCYRLKEIPIDIGEIPTLSLIEVEDCSESVVTSARVILEEQRECGNYDLQVRVRSSLEGMKTRWYDLD